MADITIIPYAPQHWLGVWAIFSAVVQAGQTYSYAPNTTEAEAKTCWLKDNAANPMQQTFVAIAPDTGKVVGTYYIKPNHAGNASHVCNAGFMVSPAARGLGVGRTMGKHALHTAKQWGYVAMQFNLVVSTNTAAIKLWQSLGFAVVATLPKAYRHSQQGLVDAHVMYQLL